MNSDNSVYAIGPVLPRKEGEVEDMSATAGVLENLLREAEARGDLVTPDYEGFHERAEVLAQIADELERQDAKWGVQDHPFVSGRDNRDNERMRLSDEVRMYFQEQADAEKQSNDLHVQYGTLDWRGILLEEVYEALAEFDPSSARDELIQVAAVAIQAALSIDRNGLDGARG